MSRTLFVDCPVCQEILEVNPETGKVIKHQQSKIKGKSKEDAFSDALKETQEREKKLTEQFDQAKLAEREKLKKLEEKFKEKKKKVDSGEVEDPLRPFDLD